jgi:hypothetical protein
MAEPVPASSEPLNTLSRRLLNIHALVLSKSEHIQDSGYVQLNNYLAEWEKSFLPASDCTQAVQNNEGGPDLALPQQPQDNGETGSETRSEDEVQSAAAKRGSKAAKKEDRRAAGEDTRPKAKVENVPSNAGRMYEVPFIQCRQTTADNFPVPNGFLRFLLSS